MLVELVVENLGVIESARIPLSGGMSALTGETGAGKTMLVDALRLLVGERADPSKVRPGASEAVVEGLFVVAGDAGPDVAYPDDHDPRDNEPRDNEPVAEREWVLRRVVPAEGRSRSYVNGALATAASVGEMARGLLEIHGQHAQQALLEPAAQRDALDRFAGIDPAPTRDARRNLRELTDELAGLGGDERELARHMELLEYQLEEIAAVAPIEGEDAELEAEEDTLASAVEYRSDAARALDLLTGGGGESADVAAEQIARARSILGSAKVFEEISSRLAALGEELADCAADLRNAAENIEPDHERLAEVRSRRQALVELRRKYGATVTEILEFESERKEELAGLRGLTERRERLGEQIAEAQATLARRAGELGDARRKAAPELALAVQSHLADLAMPDAEVEIAVGDGTGTPGAGDAVEIRLAANRGAPGGPLARVASGGELSRVMLALRLVLSGGPPTMVFDEVDAGIGGRAALAVGEALARLGSEHQVLVVTHLPQVAAFADAQVSVRKDGGASGAITTTTVLDEQDRIVEVSRMLSGQPDSSSARQHAAELLSEARRILHGAGSDGEPGTIDLSGDTVGAQR